ncbi:MAG: KOW domain-containing RNA-binding protein [Desulfotomaculaceae bacterium]|nr:KOW domain-containing RNA-binding protein [Desulfotomaculaceae bacterium]
MSENVVQIGRLVCSMQGRDSGRYYLVVGSVNDTRILLTDGEVRKVENPKIKNVKHLKFYDMIAGEVFNKATNGKRITNVDVRKELKSLIEQV